MLKKIKDKIKHMYTYGIIFALKYNIYAKKKLFLKKNKLVAKKIEEIFANKEYESNKERLFEPKIDTYLYKDKIWVFWWQGLDEAPKIIKVCINNMKKYIKDKEIIIITKDNFSYYANLPSYIMEKFNSGYISIQAFSDIIRIYLLYYYGGAWLDATLFIKNKLNPNMFNYEFYTIKREQKDDIFISNYRWTSFFLIAKPRSLLFKYLLNMNYYYWEKYNIVIDYLLTDCFINYLYDNYEQIRKLIDDVPINNIHVNDLLEIINNEYKEEKINILRENTFIYKLSWKEFIDYKKENSVYKYFVEKDM
ncbi:hypothetical protein INF25_05335 [Megamonas funiformis]|jgi:hypothetical protein|nr:hypothetical protein [Megamonas funiformis]